MKKEVKDHGLINLEHFLFECRAPRGTQTKNVRSYLIWNSKSEMEDELRSEYGLAQMGEGSRGKYVERYCSGTNLVRLDPDVAQAFPNDAAVNEALRPLMQVAQRQQPNTAV